MLNVAYGFSFCASQNASALCGVVDAAWSLSAFHDPFHSSFGSSCCHGSASLVSVFPGSALVTSAEAAFHKHCFHSSSDASSPARMGDCSGTSFVVDTKKTNDIVPTLLSHPSTVPRQLVFLPPQLTFQQEEIARYLKKVMVWSYQISVDSLGRRERGGGTRVVIRLRAV